jgi:hypothetical protein
LPNLPNKLCGRHFSHKCQTFSSVKTSADHTIAPRFALLAYMNKCNARKTVRLCSIAPRNEARVKRVFL